MGYAVYHKDFRKVFHKLPQNTQHIIKHKVDIFIYVKIADVLDVMVDDIVPQAIATAER